MKIRETLIGSAAKLCELGIQSSKLEAEVLLRHVLDIDRAEFFASLNQELTQAQVEHVSELVTRRLKREPLAYILGHREFFGLDFIVSPHVLIPRQEIELLVEMALSFMSEKCSEHLVIADVGTGSGAIAAAIAYSLPNATVYATDISLEALSVAKANADRHGVSERVHFVYGDLFEGLPLGLDIIVSNPPYLKSGEIPKLDAEVRKEPIFALDGGADGLDVIRRLIEQAPNHIKQDGCILVEMEPDQTELAREMAQKYFPNSSVSIYKDLLGLPRAIEIRLGDKNS